MEFESIIPIILYSTNIAKSIAYYICQLAFDEKWKWDYPATFGGVSTDYVRLFFRLKEQSNPRSWLVVNVDNADEYFRLLPYPH